MIFRALRSHLAHWGMIGLGALLALSLTACDTRPLQAENRLFLDLSLELLGTVELPTFTFQDTPVGGLSGITYDRQNDRYYAISDDRSILAPARFYQLKLATIPDAQAPEKAVEVESVTFLKDTQGELYAPHTIDTEAIALSPRHTLYIASEGNLGRQIPPFIGEFDPTTGQLLNTLGLPKRFLPNTPIRNEEDIPHGIRDNLGFESLTLGITSLAPDDPFRLFTAPESALLQDQLEQDDSRLRLLHYVINPIGPELLISENLYLLDPIPPDSITLAQGLVELFALEREGYLLSLERTLSFTGFGAKLFQLSTGNATDTSRIETLSGSLSNVEPLRKQLLLNLEDLGIPLDNLEGMTLGPRLPDGSQILLLVSDNNFSEDQVTQFIWFRFTQKP